MRENLLEILLKAQKNEEDLSKYLNICMGRLLEEADFSAEQLALMKKTFYRLFEDTQEHVQMVAKLIKLAKNDAK